MTKDANHAPTLLDRVEGLLDTLGAVADHLGDWAAETQTSLMQARRRGRIARRTATADEVLSWAAGELGNLGEMHLKNLILQQVADRQRCRREAEALIRQAFPAGSDDISAEIAQLLAELRKDTDDGADGCAP
jgi:hypothetical protein